MTRPSPLERALGIRFRSPELREQALSHRSFAFERGTELTNERLEFLGDAVLGLVVTDLAFRSFPEESEGDLAKLRAAMVNMTTLADVARDLGLGDELLLGRGEELSGGREKTSILADGLEAVLGAVYLDRGLKTAFELIERLFRPRMEAYVRERGPDHAKEFTATVHLAGRESGSGTGRSKKEAEQRAAREAYERLVENAAELAKEH